MFCQGCMKHPLPATKSKKINKLVVCVPLFDGLQALGLNYPEEA